MIIINIHSSIQLEFIKSGGDLPTPSYYAVLKIEIRFLKNVFFFFSAYRPVEDHCCLQEVSQSFSVVSQVKSYIMSS